MCGVVIQVSESVGVLVDSQRRRNQLKWFLAKNLDVLPKGFLIHFFLLKLKARRGHLAESGSSSLIPDISATLSSLRLSSQSRTPNQPYERSRRISSCRRSQVLFSGAHRRPAVRRLVRIFCGPCALWKPPRYFSASTLARLVT